MKFDIHQDDLYTLLTLKADKLDSKGAPDLKSQFILLANTTETGHLIVDMSTVAFADSSGLSALLLAHRLYRDTDRKLILCGLNDKVMKLIQISKLETVFTIAESKDAALETLDELTA